MEYSRIRNFKTWLTTTAATTTTTKEKSNVVANLQFCLLGLLYLLCPEGQCFPVEGEKTVSL